STSSTARRSNAVAKVKLICYIEKNGTKVSACLKNITALPGSFILKKECLSENVFRQAFAFIQNPS
ncbi:hypothetical protein, partial [Neisseria sp.]|uniref:hypothetical protein n=1 Tax=Neisseria sp. TaxID=192066 RepID=UPI00289C305C